MTKPPSQPNVLGVYLGHDLGACLLQQGQISVMVEEERLNRFKHGRPNSVAGLWNRFAGKFGYFPWASVSYCLEAADLRIDDLDLIAVGDHLWGSGAVETIHAMIPIQDKEKVVFITEPSGAVHHFHHGLSAFFASPFETAAVLVVDADGNSNDSGYEAETGYLFENRDGKHELIFKNRYRDEKIPKNGIGWTYEQITYLLGFASPKVFLADAGKTMGLAGHGGPRAGLETPWITAEGFDLDFSGFRRWLVGSGYDSRILRYDGGLTGQGATAYAKDLAFKVQSELEEAVLHLAGELHRRTGAEDLCLAGGVFLNSVANGRLVKEGPFKRIFVQPAANDGGQAIGLAYHGHLLLTVENGNRYYSGMSVPRVRKHSGAIRPIQATFGGMRYGSGEIRKLLDDAELIYEELPEQSVLVERAAADLESQRILGWFQGGSEYGPRALGHRSILANPTLESTKDHLNARVKFREGFRPFAPSVLEDRTAEVFELDGESPYMLFVARVRDEWRGLIPAVVHIDGTARLQTVSMQTDPLFYELIQAFEKRTGIPLVLNTSFNLRGMPIVETPRDALECFLFTDMDSLYLERYRVERPDASRIRPLLSPGWTLTRSIHASQESEQVLFSSPGGDRSLHISPEIAELLTLLDGTRSLAQACRLAEESLSETGATLETPATLETRATLEIQRLVRQGAARLRVGQYLFGQRPDEPHWWQSAVAAALGGRS